MGYLQAARMLAAAAKNRQPPTAELAALAADSTAAEAPQEMEIDGEAGPHSCSDASLDHTGESGLKPCLHAACRVPTV